MSESEQISEHQNENDSQEVNQSESIQRYVDTSDKNDSQMKPITVGNLDQLLSELSLISESVKNYENKISEFQKTYTHKIVNQETDISLMKEDIRTFQTQGIKVTQLGLHEFFDYPIKTNDNSLEDTKSDSLSFRELLKQCFVQLDLILKRQLKLEDINSNIELISTILTDLGKKTQEKLNSTTDFELKNDTQQIKNQQDQILKFLESTQTNLGNKNQEKVNSTTDFELKNDVQEIKNQQDAILKLLESTQKNPFGSNHMQEFKSNEVVEGAYYGFKIFEELTVMARRYANYQADIQALQKEKDDIQTQIQITKSDTEFDLIKNYINKKIENSSLDDIFDADTFLQEYIVKDATLCRDSEVFLDINNAEQFKDKITDVPNGRYKILKSCFYLKSNPDKIIQQAELDNSNSSPNF